MGLRYPEFEDEARVVHFCRDNVEDTPPPVTVASNWHHNGLGTPIRSSAVPGIGSIVARVPDPVFDYVHLLTYPGGEWHGWYIAPPSVCVRCSLAEYLDRIIRHIDFKGLQDCFDVILVRHGGMPLGARPMHDLFAGAVSREANLVNRTHGSSLDLGQVVIWNKPRPGGNSQNPGDTQYAGDTQHADDTSHTDDTSHADDTSYADDTSHADDTQNSGATQHAGGTQNSGDTQ